MKQNDYREKENIHNKQVKKTAKRKNHGKALNYSTNINKNKNDQINKMTEKGYRRVSC